MRNYLIFQTLWPVLGREQEEAERGAGPDRAAPGDAPGRAHHWGGPRRQEKDLGDDQQHPEVWDLDHPDLALDGGVRGTVRQTRHHGAGQLPVSRGAAAHQVMMIMMMMIIMMMLLMMIMGHQLPVSQYTSSAPIHQVSPSQY